ncbi:MAG: hypothetical protein IPL78_26365 [Chloroflexi bacterium]|nr:hypothetical protein [Chloroflexota bacterium]
MTVEKNEATTIHRSEWRAVWVVVLGVMALAMIPYITGYLLSRSPYHFVGIVFNLEDYRTYLAKMWLGYRGDWLYTSTFTTQEHPAAFVYPFYILLGHVARWLGLSLPLTYQLARIVSGVALLLMVYRFAAAFLPRTSRWYAFRLTATASGFGWLTLFLGRCPGLAKGRLISGCLKALFSFPSTPFPILLWPFSAFWGFFSTCYLSLKMDQRGRDGG